MSNNIGQSAAPLSWDYRDRARTPEYRATYRGYTIHAVQDESAENPFIAWDCEPPTLVYAGRRDGFSDYADGALHRPLAEMSDAQVSRHWRAIAKALNVSEADHESEVREEMAAQRHNAKRGYGAAATVGAVRRDLFDSALDDARQYGNGSDYLETLAALWRIAGCVAETWSAHGYSQGDWAKGLSVATPEWAKATGAPKDSHAAQMKAAGELWGAWAWGDVYGFICERADGDDVPDGSVWGFYGSDFAKSGLEESARYAVDYDIKRRAKARQNRAREVIKARVPLALRPALLNQAEAGV